MKTIADFPKLGIRPLARNLGLKHAKQRLAGLGSLGYYCLL